MNEQPHLFEMPEPVAPAPHAAGCLCADCMVTLKRSGENPMLAVYGPGPEGARCEDCVFLQRFHQATSWQKCALRQAHKNRHVHGDHRIRWAACAKYQQAPSEEEENLKRVRPSEPINLVMERIRRSLEERNPMKPVLHIDLSGPAGNIFVVVGKAQDLLDEQTGKEMWQKVQETHSYKDALDVVNGYVAIDEDVL